MFGPVRSARSPFGAARVGRGRVRRAGGLGARPRCGRVRRRLWRRPIGAVAAGAARFRAVPFGADPWARSPRVRLRSARARALPCDGAAPLAGRAVLATAPTGAAGSAVGAAAGGVAPAAAATAVGVAAAGGSGSSASSSAGSSAAGSRTRNSAPPPGFSSTHTFPSCAATTSATMARPRPEPPSARARASSSRTNRSKIRLRSSAGTPGPSSATSRAAWSPSRPSVTTTCEPACRCALSTRLRSTRTSWPRSPTTRTCSARTSVRTPSSYGRRALRLDDLVEVHLVAPRLQAALVGAGEQQEVVHQPSEPLGLAAQRAARCRGRCPAAAPGPRRWWRAGCAARGWRRRRTAAAPSARCSSRAIIAVHGLGEPTHLVARRGHRHALGQVLLAHRRHLRADRLDRAQRPACEEVGGRAHDEDEERHPERQVEHDRVLRGVDRRQRRRVEHDEVHLVGRGRDAADGHEHRVHRAAAVGHERRGHHDDVARVGREVAHRAERAVVGAVLQGPAAAVLVVGVVDDDLRERRVAASHQRVERLDGVLFRGVAAVDALAVVAVHPRRRSPAPSARHRSRPSGSATAPPAGSAPHPPPPAPARPRPPPTARTQPAPRRGPAATAEPVSCDQSNDARLWRR